MFVPNLRKGAELLQVFTKIIRMCERGSTPPSNVYSTFLNLEGRVSNLGISAVDKTFIKKAVKRRFDFIYGDVPGVAYLLDPRFVGMGMDSITRTSVEDFVCAWHGQENEAAVVEEITAYTEYVQRLETIDPRSVRLLDEGSLSPHQFWVTRLRFPMLREVALTAFSSVCSSAASERNFSSHKFIHTRLRNRLSEERVQKLVHVYFNGKFTDDELEQLIEDVEAAEESTSDDEPAETGSEYRYH